MEIERVDNRHKDFTVLTDKLDAELHDRYGTSQSAYDGLNVIESLNTAIVGYIDKRPVACGCFKVIDKDTIEVKRMYVDAGYRGNGFSVILLQALENWGSELGYTQIILETGKKQPEALALYKKCRYDIIDNYGPYKDMENSICMRKTII